MKKRKVFTLILTMILSVVLAFGIFIYMKDDDYDSTHVIKDTLPDGGGKKATVILLGGQSNASGCSRDEYLRKNTTPEEYAKYEAGYDNVYINYYVSGSNVSEEFVKCGACQGENGGFFGPELGIADKLNELYPDRTFFIIKCAWGGTNLYEQWKSPSSFGKTGSLYNTFVSYVNTSLEYLVSKNYDIEIEAMCWMQGESDSVNLDVANNYDKNLKNFISDIRKEFSDYASDDGIAFVDAYICDASIYWTYADEVNDAKRRVADSSPINAVVDTVAAELTVSGEPEESPDIAHYDALSELKLGWMFAKEAAKFFD